MVISFFHKVPILKNGKKAAKAAKDVIDMNIYELYKDQTEADPLLRAIKSYQGVLLKSGIKRRSGVPGDVILLILDSEL